MKEYLVSMLFLLLAPFTATAYSDNHPGCSGDCTQCHTLDTKEAQEIIRKGNPKLTVTDVKMAPVKGLWQIELESEGQRGAVFLDFSKKNLLEVQRIIPIETMGKPAPQRKIDFSLIPLKDAVRYGAKNAKKRVAVFTDPDCPYCRKLHEEMKQVLAKRKDVAFYLILNPLPMHKDAYKKVQAVLCERSLSLADDAFAGKALPEPKCGNEQVEKNIALAKELQFGSTPTLVRDDGMVLSGALPADRLIEWIDGK